MGYLYVLGYVLIVGIATFLMKVGLRTLNPYQLNFLMGIGMLITGVPALLIADKSFKLPVKELPLGMLIGVMMAGGSILYVLAFNKLSAGIAFSFSNLLCLDRYSIIYRFLKRGHYYTKSFRYCSNSDWS